MALDGTYTGLKASIADWLDRDDLTAIIPDFIALFESTANTEGAIRTQFNKTSTSATTVGGTNYVSLPTDWLGTESIILTKSGGGFEPLKPYGTAAALYTDYPNAALTQGQSKGFLLLASKVELAPVPDIAYTLTHYYYQKIPALASNSTNWLLTNFPQLYLFGSLVASEAYLGADPRLKLWGDLYDNAVQKLGGATDRDKYGGSALVATVDATA